MRSEEEIKLELDHLYQLTLLANEEWVKRRLAELPKQPETDEDEAVSIDIIGMDTHALAKSVDDMWASQDTKGHETWLLGKLIGRIEALRWILELTKDIGTD
ncbi:hypothetical protein LCGC14_3113210 [marine sediment metagenome]|uniref:Uncharacterized protein n=1 Tax=marine sediment metagenome TaxID=412755 RepID=A0A0F8W4V9_9ZZZZ